MDRTHGGTATEIDYATMTGADLAIAGKEIWGRVGPQLPRHVLEKFEPLFTELVERVESIDTPDKGRTF